MLKPVVYTICLIFPDLMWPSGRFSVNINQRWSFGDGVFSTRFSATVSNICANISLIHGSRCTDLVIIKQRNLSIGICISYATFCNCVIDSPTVRSAVPIRRLLSIISLAVSRHPSIVRTPTGVYNMQLSESVNIPTHR